MLGHMDGAQDLWVVEDIGVVVAVVRVRWAGAGFDSSHLLQAAHSLSVGRARVEAASQAQTGLGYW